MKTAVMHCPQSSQQARSPRVQSPLRWRAERRKRLRQAQLHQPCPAPCCRSDIDSICSLVAPDFCGFITHILELCDRQTFKTFSVCFASIGVLCFPPASGLPSCYTCSIRLGESDLYQRAACQSPSCHSRPSHHNSCSFKTWPDAGESKRFLRHL